MAITVTPQIAGQVASSTYTYCYLYEPLRVFIEESDLSATKIYIDITPYSTGSGVPGTTLVKYAEYDINPGVGLTVDLMKITQQINDANAYKFASVDDIATGINGYKSVITDFKYNYAIYSDITVTATNVKKLPIIGNRDLEQFVPAVTAASPVNEFEYYNLDIAELESRWSGVSLLQTSFTDPTLSNARPTLTKVTNSGDSPCGGFVIWKSRFGGWMFWGFKIQTRTFAKNYEKRLSTEMFESTLDSVGDPYVPVNYTGINTSYGRTLKALGLSSDELLAVSGIHASPAVYYQRPGTTELELMRMTSFSAPISTLASGGDFSITLRSISKLNQLTM